MSTTAIPPTDLPPLDGAPEVPTNEEDDGELVIHVAELLSLADPPTPKQSLLASQSAPSLNAGAIATDNAEGEVEEVIATPVVEPPVRNQRRSLGKRSITREYIVDMTLLSGERRERCHCAPLLLLLPLLLPLLLLLHLCPLSILSFLPSLPSLASPHPPSRRARQVHHRPLHHQRNPRTLRQELL